MNVLSLFDGISCGRVALERAGIKVDKYFASEIKNTAIKCSSDNYPDIGVTEHIKLPSMPDVYDWETTEDIADYFDLPFDEDADYSEYNDQYDTVYATLYRVWGESKNNYSNYIRSFFRRVNDRFGTKFPS